MSRPTNTELAGQIKTLENKSNNRHKSILNAFSRFKKEIRAELKPIQDYLVGIEAIEKNEEQQARNKKDSPITAGSITIPEKVWEVVKLLIIIIAVLVGAKI